MSQIIQRVVLVLLVVVVGVETFLALSAYNAVQAQVARIAIVERDIALVKAEAAAGVKQIQDELARIRRP